MRFWHRHDHNRSSICAVDPADSGDIHSFDHVAAIPVGTLAINYRGAHGANRTWTFALHYLPPAPSTPHRNMPIVTIATEVLYHGWATLFPAERMAIIGGRRMGPSIIFGPTFDVTNAGPETHAAHVRGDVHRLRAGLLALERAGAHLAGWMHSHPGCGPRATEPSLVDRAQHRDLIRDYGPSLIGLIVVADGFVRLWGTAVDTGVADIRFIGTGITPVPDYRHVYQLSR